MLLSDQGFSYVINAIGFMQKKTEVNSTFEKTTRVVFAIYYT
jgi:hypothetical protein